MSYKTQEKIVIALFHVPLVVGIVGILWNIIEVFI